MKKAILLCGMLLAMTASVATAGPGVNLRWTKCFGNGTGTVNRTFACNTNAGSNISVGSFTHATDMLAVSGNEQVVDLAAAAASLPAWWSLKTAGNCRTAALAANMVDPGDLACPDWGGGVAAGNIAAYQIGLYGPNTARVKMASAVAPSALQDLFGGQEYYSFTMTVTNVKTVGTGLCAGCATPVCLVLSSIKCTSPDAANNRVLSGPGNGTDSNFITWQGGGVPVTNIASGCPAATPAKNRTWGQVKSLYR